MKFLPILLCIALLACTPALAASPEQDVELQNPNALDEPGLLDGFCPDYGIKCYRAWTEADRPAWLDRILAPEGDYMGSIRLPQGRTLQWPCLDCEARGEHPGGNWAQACNEAYPECVGRCQGE